MSSLRDQLCKLLNCPKVISSPPLVTGGPTISVINKATVDLGLPTGKTYADLIKSLQVLIDTIFAPVWGTPCKLVQALDFVPGTWSLVFLDDADAANALGYHDITPDGLPLGKVFVKTTKRSGELVSVTASHELEEMLVDPSINLLATGVISVEDAYAYEVSDAVEDSPFITVDGIPHSNFVLPSYFEDFHPSGTKYDQLGVLTRSFSLAPGGYMAILKGGSWTQIFGSLEKERVFLKEDRRQHRSELRMRKLRGEKFKRSLFRR